MTGNVQPLAVPPRIDVPVKTSQPITVSAHVWAGPGIGLVEVQALIEPAAISGKGKVSVVGVPKGQVQQILTVLKIPGLIGILDHDIHVRLVGTDRFQQHFGLGLYTAIVGSYFRRPIPRHLCYVGEIDLTRHIRGGSVRIVEHLRLAIDGGEIGAGTSVLLPSSLDVHRLAGSGTTIISCATVADVIGATWPHLSATVQKN